MHIKDYGKKPQLMGKNYYGEDDYDCDDQIQIDGHKFSTTNEYCIDTDVYSSASSFKGNIVVSGYVNQVTLMPRECLYYGLYTRPSQRNSSCSCKFLKTILLELKQLLIMKFNTKPLVLLKVDPHL